MASLDMKAMFDYILKKTNKSSLSYIAHSQGTTIGLAAFSESPELTSKVNLFIGEQQPPL
jgi:pimeloyl-ACP methyl ester carboxylesterase